VPSSAAETAIFVSGIHATSVAASVCEGTDTRRSASETVAYTSGDGIVAHKMISSIACAKGIPCRSKNIGEALESNRRSISINRREIEETGLEANIKSLPA
jgi:hypothetical protein